MDSNVPIPNPQTPESQDEEDGTMRIDKSQSETSEERSQEDTEAPTSSPTVIPKYYSVMDDEGPDEVFIVPSSLPPPSRLDPEGGSTCELATDPSVTRAPSDATEAQANPECLDWHPAEKQIMAAHSQVKEEMARALPTFEKGISSNFSCDIEGTGEDQASIDGTVNLDDTLGKDSNITAEDKETEEDHMVSKELLEFSEQGAEIYFLEESGLKDVCPTLGKHDLTLQGFEIVTDDNQHKMDATTNQRQDLPQEESKVNNDAGCLDDDLTRYDWVRRSSGTDDPSDEQGLNQQAEKDGSSRIGTEILQGKNLLQRLQLVQLRQDISECQSTQKQKDHLTEEGNLTAEESTVKDPAENIQGIKGNEDQELNVGSAQFENPCTGKTEADVCYNEESDDWKSAHLQVIGADEATHIPQHAERVQEQPDVSEGWSLPRPMEKECGKVESTVKDEVKKTNVEERNNSSFEGNRKESTPSAQKKEAEDSEQSDSWKLVLPLTIKDETRVPFALCHQSSAAETSVEKHRQETSQRNQDLQRTEGVFDLTDNPDVLEIPFKTNISLEALPRKESPDQRSDWQFSEQKMQKEISQEMQRELVLVNQGKLPGGYSKGESRQMKDTKLLFELFQQEKVEGPTSYRKPPSSLLKSQVYPSVLERTRSLEMFSLKTFPILRTHSFRLVSSTSFENETYPENPRSRSPSGSSRDKMRLSPYPKPEKPLRMHKSMDSISQEVFTAVDKIRKTKEELARECSPILKENPFFKLRPALALQPEVEKDIRESKKREEELRKQRCTLYGEGRHSSSKEEVTSTSALKTDPRHKSTGKLERVWPPPSKKDLTKTEQAQQEAKVQRGAGQRAPLWQRWESGLINGQTPPKDNN